MRGWLRVGLIGTGGVVALAAIGAGVFVATFDPNTQKERIVEAVRRATGRELVLAGPLRLSLGWTPTIEAEDAALSNRPGGSRPQMATVARLRASVALLPLLSGRVDVESIRLDRPDILLETDAHGIGNWQFQRPVAEAAPVSAGEPATRARTSVAIRRVTIENGRLTWRNETSGRATVVDVPHAVLDLDQAQITLAADAQTSGQALRLDAVIGQNEGERPLKLKLTTAGAVLSLDGSVVSPLSAWSYRGKVDATIPDLAAMAGLLRLPALPNLKDLHLAMVAGADGMPQEIVLHAGGSDLGGVLPGAVLTRLDATMPALGQSGRIAAEGVLPGGPWTLASGFNVAGQTLALRALSVVTPGADLAGDLAVSRGDRWILRGTVASQRIDLDWLRNLKPVRPAAEAAVQPPANPPPPPTTRVFSTAPLPWARLRAADADLQFTLGDLHAGTADYRGLSGRMTLTDGALRLDPLTMQTPRGRIDGSLTADASQPEPPVAVVARSASFALDPILQAAGLPGGSDAMVELDVALSSAGQSVDALMSRLNGQAALAMVDGAVSNAVLAAAFGTVLPKAVRLDPAGSSAVRCLALRAEAKDGQVAIAALDLDTSRLALDATGAVDLAAETLALRLRPTVRVGGTGILAPVRMEGSLAHPVVALDSQGVEGRSGIVIGGPPAADTCSAALTIARGGRAGPMPGPAVVKSSKPADLLRSFLR